MTLIASLETRFDKGKSKLVCLPDLAAGTEPMRTAVRSADAQRVEHLLEAEGYFRALADGLWA